MTQQVIGVGTVANDGTGDPLRTAFMKANDNETELYSGLGGLVAKTGVAASVTGTTTETALATINIPGGLIGVNGEIIVRSYWSLTSSANNKLLKVRLGGLSGSVVGGLTATAISGTMMETVIRNKNSASSQYLITLSARGTDNLMLTSNSTPTTVNTAASQDLVISGQLVNTGETITLEGYTVEYRK